MNPIMIHVDETSGSNFLEQTEKLSTKEHSKNGKNPINTLLYIVVW
jgi:hypothetical protein